MKRVSVMIKPASSGCNIRCRYCFYLDVAARRETASFGIMSEDAAADLVKNVYADLEDGDDLTLAFQGGEPTIAGLPWFRRFVSLVKAQTKKVSVSWALQTNALLLDEEWCEFLKENRVLVGVSLDGYREANDASRVDAAGKGTYQRIMQSVKLLRKHKVDFNVLMTLTNELARHPQLVWKEIVKQDFRFVQFTPCLGELEEEKRTPYELTPVRFVSFYEEIFRVWVQEFRKGNYYSIKLFDDLINLLAKGEVNACGLVGFCGAQFVVEADGSAYPCDFYVLDRWKLGSVREKTLSALFESEAGNAFRIRPADRLLCGACPYRRICGGGCRRMQASVCYGPGETDCGYRMLLEKILPELQQIAQRFR